MSQRTWGAPKETVVVWRGPSSRSSGPRSPKSKLKAPRAARVLGFRGSTQGATGSWGPLNLLQQPLPRMVREGIDAAEVAARDLDGGVSGVVDDRVERCARTPSGWPAGAEHAA